MGDNFPYKVYEGLTFFPGVHIPVGLASKDIDAINMSWKKIFFFFFYQKSLALADMIYYIAWALGAQQMP